MAYCALADITATIPEQTVTNLTDDSGTGEADQGKVTAAIADADAEIDSYCAARYTVPFSPVPAVIRKCSVDVSVYNLYSRCAESIPDSRKERYKNAIELLKNIAKGVVTLGEVPSPATNPESAGRPEITSSTRLFTRDTMKDL